MNYHPAEKEVLALLMLLKTCYTQLAGRTIHVYTRFSTLEWVHTSTSLFGRTTQFAVMLSPWHLVVTRVKEKDCSFAQLLQAGRTSFVDLEDSLATVTPPTKGSSTARMDPQLLYARLPRTYSGLVVSFDGSAKTEKLAIQQSLGVIACKKESLMTQLNRHRELVARLKSVKYLDDVQEYNASADSLATEALENKASNVISDESRLAELNSLNRTQEVIYAPISLGGRTLG
ncbi:hypothetical protein PHMEG_00035370 [Phytophthora megakarya]|uniref:Reverse transcriptase RNase H-like domain-containing protein n=1 Tax=Phytophthora megakarya TaxID=4795 RepID=A0A225UNI2_9STRA|nr:hypothetical protein PHMEG_00035370 [Phytophthora megakarya]